MYEFEGAEGGRIRLSFDASDWAPNTDSVLVVPFYHKCVLFTKHQQRGWELPGGTRERGEFPIQTALRELYEETGAEASEIRMIGQYCLEHPDLNNPMIKSIYVANICDLHPLPKGFETEEVVCLGAFPDWQEVRRDSRFSFILKDDVYRYLVDFLKHKNKAKIKASQK